MSYPQSATNRLVCCFHSSFVSVSLLVSLAAVLCFFVSLSHCLLFVVVVCSLFVVYCSLLFVICCLLLSVVVIPNIVVHDVVVCWWY